MINFHLNLCDQIEKYWKFYMHRLAFVLAKRAFNSGNDDGGEGGGDEDDDDGVRPYSKCHQEYLSQFKNQAILVEIITNSQTKKRTKSKTE